MVPQEGFLFDTTVAGNLLYGRPDASEEEIVDAAKRANADIFIRRFDDGYDTTIGERGLKLSGGQKQRIAVARAVPGVSSSSGSSRAPPDRSRSPSGGR